MLAADHGLDVVTEDHLAVGTVFGFHNIDGLVGVDGIEAASAQFFRDAGAQNGGAVHADDGIHGSIVNEVGHQLVSAVLGLAQAGLLVSDINVVVDMGMVGCKVAAGNTQGGLTMTDGQVHKLDHILSSIFLID